MQRQGAKNHRQSGPAPAETKHKEMSGRKSPQKGLILRCTGNVRFAKTGWWRHSGTNWRPTTQSSNQSRPPEPGTEYLDAETGHQLTLTRLRSYYSTNISKRTRLNRGRFCGSLLIILYAGKLITIEETVTSGWHWLLGPIQFLIIEADFDGWLDHGKIGRDVEVAWSI
jgi:hypothetical protein